MCRVDNDQPEILDLTIMNGKAHHKKRDRLERQRVKG